MRGDRRGFFFHPEKLAIKVCQFFKHWPASSHACWDRENQSPTINVVTAMSQTSPTQYVKGEFYEERI